MGRKISQGWSQAALTVRRTMRGVNRALNHPLFLAALVTLAAMVAAATGYLYYETGIRHPRAVREMSEEAARLRSHLNNLRDSAKGLPTSIAELQRSRENRTSLLAPLDGVRALDQIALLAGRTGVELGRLNVGSGGVEDVGQVELNVYQVEFDVTGELDDLSNFYLALQEGIVPGLVVEQVQANSEQGTPALTVSGSLYGLSSQSAAFPAGTALMRAGTPAFEALGPEQFSGTSDVPILAFNVESLFDGADALRSIRVQVSPSDAIPDLGLYAEVRDEKEDPPVSPIFASILDFGPSEQRSECRASLASQCETGNNHATRVSTVTTLSSIGEFTIRPSRPFDFPGHKEIRFYITADIRKPTGPETVVEVRIPPGGVTFESGNWPKPGGEEFISRFQTGGTQEASPTPTGPSEVGR